MTEKWIFRCETEYCNTEMVIWKEAITWPKLLDKFTDFLRGSGYSYLPEIKFTAVPNSWETRYDNLSEQFQELQDKYSKLMKETDPRPPSSRRKK